MVENDEMSEYNVALVDDLVIPCHLWLMMSLVPQTMDIERCRTKNKVTVALFIGENGSRRLCQKQRNAGKQYRSNGYSIITQPEPTAGSQESSVDSFCCNSNHA